MVMIQIKLQYLVKVQVVYLFAFYYYHLLFQIIYFKEQLLKVDHAWGAADLKDGLNGCNNALTKAGYPINNLT